MVTKRSDSVVTAVTSVMLVLLPAVESVSSEVTETVLVIFPVVSPSTVTLTATVAEASTASAPRTHVTSPLNSVQAAPWLGVAETKDVPAGMLSVKVTLVASDGPPLLVMVEV